MFRVPHPDEIPEEVPRDVKLAIGFSWTAERDAAACDDWGERPLRVIRFRRQWMRSGPAADIAVLPITGVEYTADLLRRAVARADVFRAVEGVHLGTAVVTEGLLVDDDEQQLPDLPEAELRQWIHDAIAASEMTQYRGTVGVCAGWRFVIGEFRGSPVEIAGYGPDDEWDARITIIDDVMMLDRHLQSLTA